MNNARTNNSLSENISKSFIQEAQPLDIIKGYQDSSAILEKLEENLEKGLISDTEFEKALSTLDIISKGGEGSKGGKVIGHTTSGKPIYDTHDHEAHKDFTKKDHLDAAKLNEDSQDKHIAKYRLLKENNEGHSTEARRHQSRALEHGANHYYHDKEARSKKKEKKKDSPSELPKLTDDQYRHLAHSIADNEERRIKGGYRAAVKVGKVVHANIEDEEVHKQLKEGKTPDVSEKHMNDSYDDMLDDHYHHNDN